MRAVVRVRNAIHVVGLIVAAVGVAMGISGVVANILGSVDAVALYVSAGIAIMVGLMANRLTVLADDLSIRESYLIVTLSWLGAALFGALPYWLSDLSRRCRDTCGRSWRWVLASFLIVRMP